jgi:hypothetical protein
MEALQGLVATLLAKFPVLSLVLGGLGTLLVLAQVVVLVTPTKKDDEALAKAEGVPVLGSLLVLLKSFALVQKKEDGTLSLSAKSK